MNNTAKHQIGVDKDYSVSGKTHGKGAWSASGWESTSHWPGFWIPCLHSRKKNQFPDIASHHTKLTPTRGVCWARQVYSSVCKRHTWTSVGSNPSPHNHLQQVLEPKVPATSIALLARELSMISSKGGNCVVPYYVQSMTEPKKGRRISNELLRNICFIPLDSRS